MLYVIAQFKQFKYILYVNICLSVCTVSSVLYVFWTADMSEWILWVNPQHAGLSQWQKVGLDRVHEVVQSQPRLFSETMRLFVCHTCIYLSVFTDDICNTSYTYSHPGTKRSFQRFNTDPPGNPTKPALSSAAPRHAGRRFAEEMLFPNYRAIIWLWTEHRSVPAFSGRSSPYLSRGTESLSWPGYTPD